MKKSADLDLQYANKGIQILKIFTHTVHCRSNMVYFIFGSM